MLYEMRQIQDYLAKKHGIPQREGGALAADPPDGDHVIPLGHGEAPFRVEIRDGRFWILGPVDRKTLKVTGGA